MFSDGHRDIQILAHLRHGRDGTRYQHQRVRCRSATTRLQLPDHMAAALHQSRSASV